MPDRSAAWRFCVAPMMQYTDRHFRFLARRLSRHTRLYTEMVVASALLRGDGARLLAHDPAEVPVALQLGGSNPAELAAAARIGAAAGFCEVNLNVGCPSDRVQSGRFGACLIAEPALVADCVAAMHAAVGVPVTVKTRLGVDEFDNDEHLARLVDGVRQAGCRTLIVHARKALLNFSPRANREIPPLQYPRVYALKRAFPELRIIINGGIASLLEAGRHLEEVDGVMLGRAAYAQLDILRHVDRVLFGETAPPVDDMALLDSLEAYAARESVNGTGLHHLTRHLLGLRQGAPGAREWRRLIGSHNQRAGLDASSAFAEARALLRAVRRMDAA